MTKFNIYDELECAQLSTKNLADYILNYCESESLGVVAGEPDSIQRRSANTYYHLQRFTLSFMGLDDPVNLKKCRDQNLVGDMLSMTLRWIDEGAQVLEKRHSGKSIGMPVSLLLMECELDGQDDEFLRSNIHLAYYLICLFYLAEYKRLNRDETREALEQLSLAQGAALRGDHSLLRAQIQNQVNEHESTKQLNKSARQLGAEKTNAKFVEAVPYVSSIAKNQWKRQMLEYEKLYTKEKMIDFLIGEINSEINSKGSFYGFKNAPSRKWIWGVVQDEFHSLPGNVGRFSKKGGTTASG